MMTTTINNKDFNSQMKEWLNAIAFHTPNSLILNRIDSFIQRHGESLSFEQEAALQNLIVTLGSKSGEEIQKAAGKVLSRINVSETSAFQAFINLQEYARTEGGKSVSYVLRNIDEYIDNNPLHESEKQTLKAYILKLASSDNGFSQFHEEISELQKITHKSKEVEKNIKQIEKMLQKLETPSSSFSLLEKAKLVGVSVVGFFTVINSASNNLNHGDRRVHHHG